MSRSVLLVSAMLAGLLPQTGFAQSRTEADTLRLIERLRPTDQQVRGIRMPGTDSGTATPARPDAAPAARPDAAPALTNPPERSRPAAPARETTAPAGTAAVSITVNFAPGSSTLSPQAEASLTALGRALTSPELQSFRFRIEGHTDTAGDADMNIVLSQRRAEAVRDFLLARFTIAQTRLVAAGLGETQPLVQTGDNVANPRNRRVQVVNLDS